MINCVGNKNELCENYYTMKSFLLSILTAFPLLIFAHDIPLGIFNLTFEKDYIQLEIKLEIEDIENAVESAYKQKSNDRLVEQYILAHTQWIINQEVLNPQLCSTEKEEAHYYLIIHLKASTELYGKMTIFNDCLLKEVEDHSNIIYINNRGEQRGFRLDKDLVKTTFELY